MTLIQCSECSSEISDKAASCPRCGVPRTSIPTTKPQEKKTSAFTWIVGGLFAFAVFSAVWDRNNATPPPAKTPQQKAEDAKRDAQLHLAAIGVRTLKNSMKDPEAFSLKSAVVMKNGTACYEYRAKNSFGAILPGSALMTEKGKLLVQERDKKAFVSVWNKECTKSGGDDIAPLLSRLSAP